MNIYTSEAIYYVDRQAEEQGFSLFALMENAGRNIFDDLISHINERDQIVILAGRGNNGGDGIVLARYLCLAGYEVRLCFPLGEPKTEVARAHLDFYKRQSFPISKVDYDHFQADIIIDALLGVGAHPPLRRDAEKVVRWANNQQVTRYAIDVPSGVHADYGAIESGDSQQNAVAFKADATFTLHGANPSAFLEPASAFYGKLIPVSIGLKQQSDIKRMTASTVHATIPKRKNAAHKGTFGTSLLFAGSDDMPGSALLSAIGAMRSGTGKLILGTSSHAASVITPRVPEATYFTDGLNKYNQTKELPEKVRAIGIGPGLQGELVVETALKSLLKTDIPLVIDAGALLKNQSWDRPGNAVTILTPHPGEFSRLTGISTQDIQHNRIQLARQYAEANQVILVLKGNNTVIALPHGEVFLNPTGNTGLAKGGSGDVLTGMTTSMVSYYPDPVSAVKNAVYIHGLCADLWADTYSESTMVASDFQHLLPKAFRMMEKEITNSHSTSH